MKFRLFLFALICFVLGACSHGNCRASKSHQEITQGASGTQQEVSMKDSLNIDRVKVYKPDGTLQCKQGKLIPISEMQKELNGITVFSSESKNDGMMRIQVCGSPTGNSNVFEISRKDLEKAFEKGFKEWLGE